MFLSIFAAVAQPPVQLYPGVNNVYGRAQFKKDAGVVRYLGQFEGTSSCSQACLAFDADGNRCYSFTYHHQTFPSDWKGLCFGVVDHTWEARADATTPPIVTTGKVLWEEKPCGSKGVQSSCSWQLDPWCLTPVSKYAERTLTTAAAAAICALDAECVGVNLAASSARPNASSSAVPVPHTFHNSTSGSAGSCWSRRKHYANLTADPYRPAYHFAPREGMDMNDPNGPMYYLGWYHLFYQYNPSCDTPLCAREWGHAISPDMVHWRELGIALNVSHFGACGGVWSGSAMPNAPVGGGAKRPLLTYSVQCNSYLAQAEPVDASDPALLEWVRPSHGGIVPQIAKPHGTGGFRDPSAPFRAGDGRSWRVLAACNGGACQFESHDEMLSWEFIGYAAGDGEGPTWEMPDLFALGAGEGAEPLTVLKLGMENGTDFWFTGTYDANGTAAFVAGPGSERVRGDTTTQCVDYGRFYASKTFLAADGRRVIIGAITNRAGPLLAWSGLQSSPRVVSIDEAFDGRVRFWPIAELDALRAERFHPLPSQQLPPHSVTTVHGVHGARLDVTAHFAGWAPRGGVFGVSVLGGAANATITVDRARPSYMRRRWATLALGDYMGDFPLRNASLGGCDGASIAVSCRLSLRLLVDHGVVEAFASDGRAVVTHWAWRQRTTGSAEDLGVALLNLGDVPVTLVAMEAFGMAQATPAAAPRARSDLLSPTP